MLSSGEFNEIFRSAQFSVFRLEALDHYWVADDGRYQAFSRGLPRPEVTPLKSDWLDIVAKTAGAGTEWVRVHVIDELSSYVRFELEWGYPGNVRAGERIYILDSSAHGGRSAWPTRDFWLIDNHSVVWMDYDVDGRIVNRELSTDPEVISVCQVQRDTALGSATPLHVFMQHYQAISA